jgi:hypothetical protein
MQDIITWKVILNRNMADRKGLGADFAKLLVIQGSPSAKVYLIQNEMNLNCFVSADRLTQDRQMGRQTITAEHLMLVPNC